MYFFLQAKAVYKDENSIVIRAVAEPSPTHVWLVREGVDTMDRMLRTVAKEHNQRRCLGTRQILNEEDEVQPNGRIFKKVSRTRHDSRLLWKSKAWNSNRLLPTWHLLLYRK